MITEFKVGHWYKWTGPKVRPEGWNSEGKMDYMLDGKPHRCEVVEDDTFFAQLSVLDPQTWYWSDGIVYIVEYNPTGQLELDFQL